MRPQTSIHAKRSPRRHESRALRRVLAAILLAFGSSLPGAAVELVSRRLESLPVSITPGSSSLPAPMPISADGRFVAFGSQAVDLVASPPDTDDHLDVFVRDLWSGATTLVSVNLSGTAPANASSQPVAISSDGRYVLFDSWASDLVAGDVNGISDVFVRDLQLGTTELVSVNAAGSGTGNAYSSAGAMSQDGRFVAFTSQASDLVAGDANGNYADAFVRDLQADVTRLASIGTTGNPGNDFSYAVAVSDDGRYATFWSFASNFVAGDTNLSEDVFRRDLQSGTTELVSVNGAGDRTGNSFSVPYAASSNGRFVLLSSEATDLVAVPDANDGRDVFLRDMQTGLTTLVSVNAGGTAAGAAESTPAAISDDGRYVAFESDANDLVAGDTADDSDVFVRDLQTGTTTLVSAASSGVKGNSSSYLARHAMSADGRFVTFTSSASNLAPGDANQVLDVFLRDRQLGTTTLVSTTPGGQAGNGGSGSPTLSRDGRHVLLVSVATDLVGGHDGNRSTDVFIRDLQAAATVLVSVRAALPPPASGNHPSYPAAISDDGRHVLFTSWADDLASDDGNGVDDAFLRDVVTGTTTLVSRNAAGTGSAAGDSRGVGLSHGGRHVLFTSFAEDLVVGGIDHNETEDVYVRDVQAGTTQLVSVTAAGVSGGGSSSARAITPSGRYVLFHSWAADLAAEDANAMNDVFVRDLQAGVTDLVSVDLGGHRSAHGESWARTLTPDGRFVVFDSTADDLVGTPNAAGTQVYVRDRQQGATELISVNVDGTAGGEWPAQAVAIDTAGRHVLFQSYAADLAPGDDNVDQDVFVRDRHAGTTTMVSRNSAGIGSANGPSFARALSADGRYVLFGSGASDLVPNDLNGRFDVFRRDLQSGSTVLVSVNAAGTGGGNDQSTPVSMSSDGMLVTFYSRASDLVGGDGNGEGDVFLRDLQTGTTVLLSATPQGFPGNGESSACCLAASGTRAVFGSSASDLAADDLNVAFDVFAAATGREPPALPFADGFEPGDFTAWSSYQP